ncbi:MAG TPA: hypothetical protein ENI85_15985 [Deltaproteobacteria bacterium]|nr:hypothetical protein [Deltaproteobacteria bacterium]
MPRDLADVFHYFLPETGTEAEPTQELLGGSPERRPARSDEIGVTRPVPAAVPPPLPILGVPIGSRDVLRAALAWNLTIETARLGASAVILAPAVDATSPLWPAPGAGPLGTELILSSATNLADLHHAAAETAARRAARARRGGIVFVRIPPDWLEEGDPETNPFRWLLLLTSANRRDLDEAFAMAETVVASNPVAEVGVTIHGVTTIDEARRGFETLSRRVQRRLGLDLSSYGLLVDDLDVYRAIAAQRPIGLAHPQAPAARALMDVARLLYEDARSRVLG